jgi:ubiquinone/menaquinone biosynthesis C-methylase UbiE/intracellular sulfur oxidation DsrE/DsrF family protein
MLNRFFVATICFAFLTLAAATFAQEKSVKPGINDSFRDPDLNEFQGKFEVESREVYALRREIVAACKLKPGQTVADIGAGTGLFTRLFSEVVEKKGQVIAVDISLKFLDHIQKTCREAEQQNVRTLLCTADSTELPADSIDVAFICDTYHHFEFPLKTMSSLYKALKPGGRVFLIDFRRVQGESTPWVMSHVRAGQETFEDEIKQCGFRKIGEHKNLLKENYFIEFQKLEEVPELKTFLVPKTGGVAVLTGAPQGPRAGGRVVFDVTASAKSDEINPGLERAARLLNLYGAAGLKAKDVQVTIVLHGNAAVAALTDAAYVKLFTGEKNPNVALIGELRDAGVEVLICGQTLARKKIPHHDIAAGVSIATSAMTALMNRQQEGYAVICVQQ